MEKLRAYIRESYEELSTKVTWPTWTSLFDHTKLVFIATIIIAVLVLVMSILCKEGTELIYNI